MVLTNSVFAIIKPEYFKIREHLLPLVKLKQINNNPYIFLLNEKYISQWTIGLNFWLQISTYFFEDLLQKVLLSDSALLEYLNSFLS